MYDTRTDAGLHLAEALRSFTIEHPVILGLPRGGVVLAATVAQQLHAPLGIVLVYKICHPTSPEYAIGAVAENEQPVYAQAEVRDIDKQWLDHAEADARKFIAKRRKLYYGSMLHPPIVTGKTAILVDDGAATGLTMVAAIKATRSKRPKKIIVALPVVSREAMVKLTALADDIVTLEAVDSFAGAIAAHYRAFDQVTNTTVQTLLRKAYL